MLTRAYDVGIVCAAAVAAVAAGAHAAGAQLTASMLRAAVITAAAKSGLMAITGILTCRAVTSPLLTLPFFFASLIGSNVLAAAVASIRVLGEGTYFDSYFSRPWTLFLLLCSKFSAQ